MKITDILNDALFIRFEEQVSKQLGLKRSAGNSTVRDLLLRQIEDSRYDVAHIAKCMAKRSGHFERFAPAWYRDASGIDYGEEFDPEEGDQQDERSETKMAEISEGFTISYLLLWLYGTEHPDELEAWIRNRRIPAAKSVARDVRRIIDATATKGE